MNLNKFYKRIDRFNFMKNNLLLILINYYLRIKFTKKLY